jgi:thioredoxin reductase (NADPH)
VDAGENCLPETAIPGVFVAGDCRTKAIRQVTTATADGAVAALAACRYLDTL